MRDGEASTAFQEIITTLTRRRIEIYDQAGDDWRFAESLKSVSEDTAQEYEGRAVLELIQNGHDALAECSAGRIAVLVCLQAGENGVLYVANEGAGFTDSNFRAITELALSDKGAGEGIGNKGLGFRSVLQLTDWPEVYSKASPSSVEFDGFCFRFARPEDVRELVDDPELADRVIDDISPLALPVPADVTDATLTSLAAEGFSTVVRLPLRNKHAAEAAITQATEAISGEAPLLLFLDRVGELILDVQGDGDRDGRRVLARSVAPSKLVAREESRWVEEVDLAEGGRYLLARRTLAPEELRRVIEGSVEAREIDAKWLKWDGEAWVGVALRLDKDLEQGLLYTFLPMSDAARAPFRGHAHAPFFTKLARLHISETVALNAFLLDQMAQLCLQLMSALRSQGPYSAVRDLVLDLVCWDDPARIDKALAGKLADEPIVPLVGADSWGTLRSSYAWPDGRRPWTVLTAEALSQAGGRLLDSSVGPLRRGRLIKLHRDLLGTLMHPMPQTSAAWVERLAERLQPAGGEQPVPLWADFYDDLAQAFADHPEHLHGRRIILDQDGRLWPALGGTETAGKNEQSVFFLPEDEGGNGATKVPKALKALRRRMAFTHPAIAWGRPGRTFLEAHRLVRPYRTDRVFEALRDLLAKSPSDALCRDALVFAFRIFPSLTEAERGRLPRTGLRLPAGEGGWIKATSCLFSPAWRTEGGRRLAKFLEAGGDSIPSLATLRQRWLSNPDVWPVPVNDLTAYVEFLKAVGVGDGLPLSLVGGRLRPTNGRDMAPGVVARRLSLGDELGRAWSKDVHRTWSDFAHPWTPYEFRRQLAHVPGAVEVTELGTAARREFAELLLIGLRTWADTAFTVPLHRPHHDRNRDPHTWPSPLASFLRSMPWLPVEARDADGPTFVPPNRAWFSTEGELPAFVPSLPLSIRRALADKPVLERLRRCGLRFWDESEHAGAAVRDLGAIVATGGVPDHLNVSFKKHYGRAWSHVADSERWPWPAGKPAQLAVVQKHALTSLTPSSRENPVYVCDEADPLKESLVELAGHPVLIAGSDDGARIAKRLESSGTPVVRLSDTRVQVNDRAKEPISPSDDHPLLTEAREWLVLVVALVVELKSGAFVRRSERTVHFLLDQLRAIRIIRAEEIEILIAGERVEPPPTTRSLPLPDPDHPTVVVWDVDRDGDGGWEELQASTSAVTQLLHQPSLQDALELVLVKLQRHSGGAMPDYIDDHTLALALDTNESRISEIRRSLTNDLPHMVRQLRPVLVCLAGTDRADTVSEALDEATNEEELIAVLGRFPCALPLPATELLAVARTSTTPAELREALALDYKAFNEALAALGAPYKPVCDPDLHERTFSEFVRVHADAVLDRLRERYAPQAAGGADVAAYAAARHLEDLAPDPDWLPRFASPPEEQMRERVAHWLRSHGADDDLERAGNLEPVDELRRLNTAALDRLVSVLTKLVPAWCRSHHAPVPAGWNSTPLMAARTALQGSGLADLFLLSNERLLSEVARGVGWPVGMPHSADLAALGLTARDVAQPSTPSSGFIGSGRSVQPTIKIGEEEIVVGRDHFTAIADLAARTVDETFLAQSGKVRLGTMAAVPQPRRTPESRTPRIVVAHRAQLGEEQKAAIGLVGEVSARAWLERRYAEVHWVSGYAAVLNEDAAASDGHGYDFEVAYRGTTRLYEVKATSESHTERMEFELGISEERAAREHARGTRYRILLITSALDPDRRQVFELPNPFALAGRDRFLVVGRGLRYQFSPTRGTSRPVP
ncbi:sacsin N-terminal ATP-binding-like domain-containing protein [Streptomyces lateritius]|uniref:sacsin N-terminal ATP-binding-like domain-containing protein n=1 Tax=Streptomyces lateritius TaxID=67313 RepID=UPI00167A6C19|nr:hypothetical protein [Streptomyces lateritius]GGU06863.1 hypothetical protein GCM10010272_60180 [Streptomyces lateritius]